MYIKFSIELNTFQIDDKDVTTNNICEKMRKFLKWMDDASVHHRPGKMLIFSILGQLAKLYPD